MSSDGRLLPPPKASTPPISKEAKGLLDELSCNGGSWLRLLRKSDRTRDLGPALDGLRGVLPPEPIG
jgi:hypothetical protein